MNKNDSFSVRMGIEPAQPVQMDGLNKSARLGIYKVADTFLPKPGVRYAGGVFAYNQDVWLDVARKFLSLDHVVALFGERMSHTFEDKFRGFFHEKWYNIFDLMEYLHENLSRFIPNMNPEEASRRFHTRINSLLAEENVGYRFMGGKFIPITNENELAEITRAANTPYQNANTHISKAIALLSNRENPDYANSIKESITAVEAAAKELTGDNNATLGAALKKLDSSGIKTHPAFNEAMRKLYAFASDDDGIRHGGSGDPIQQDQPTARYMLITCSAFINYLIANAPTDKK